MTSIGTQGRLELGKMKDANVTDRTITNATFQFELPRTGLSDQAF